LLLKQAVEIRRHLHKRITDFVKGKISSSLPKSSYFPGIISAPLHEFLSESISKNLAKAILIFNKKMRGYFTEEAQILAAETRTSSPIRIPRNNETLMHIETEGLFPCGEEQVMLVELFLLQLMEKTVRKQY